jgi:hypothetical protein
MTTSDHLIYSQLRYHDVRREENLIVGVLLIFPASGKVQFLHPEHLDRLKAAFPDCPQGTIRAYFEGFTHRCKEIMRQETPLPTTVQDAGPFIAAHFLTEDGSALQFSISHLAVLSTENLDVVFRSFYKRYLETYDLVVGVA